MCSYIGFPNHIEFNGQDYSIFNYVQAGLFKPEDFGIDTYFSFNPSFSTNYVIRDGGIILMDLWVKARDNCPAINGQIPTPYEFIGFECEYHNLNMEFKTNCKLLVGREKTSSSMLYPIAHRDLVGLHFHGGDLIEAIDYSKEAKHLRYKQILRRLIYGPSFEAEYKIISPRIPIYDYGFKPSFAKDILAGGARFERKYRHIYKNRRR